MMDVIYMGNTPAGRQDPEPARCLPRQAHVSRRTHQAKINLSRKLELATGGRHLRVSVFTRDTVACAGDDAERQQGWQSQGGGQARKAGETADQHWTGKQSRI